MRKIKFLPDTGNMITVEAANNLTVDQFITALTAKGGQFDLSKNLLTEKKSKASYLDGTSVLPDGDISLFSTIKDPKGNAPTTRADVYDAIKALKETYGDYVKTHFGNYTQVATHTLINLLKNFSKSEARKSMGNKKVSSTKSVTVKKQVSKEEQELIELRKTFKPSIYRK
jgi:hypothetical protein